MIDEHSSPVILLSPSVLHHIDFHQNKNLREAMNVGTTALALPTWSTESPRSEINDDRHWEVKIDHAEDCKNGIEE
jgi:hypothetical protein